MKNDKGRSRQPDAPTAHCSSCDLSAAAAMIQLGLDGLYKGKGSAAARGAQRLALIVAALACAGSAWSDPGALVQLESQAAVLGLESKDSAVPAVPKAVAVTGRSDGSKDRYFSITAKVEGLHPRARVTPGRTLVSLGQPVTLDYSDSRTWLENPFDWGWTYTARYEASIGVKIGWEDASKEMLRLEVYLAHAPDDCRLDKSESRQLFKLGSHPPSFAIRCGGSTYASKRRTIRLSIEPVE